MAHRLGCERAWLLCKGVETAAQLGAFWGFGGVRGNIRGGVLAVLVRLQTHWAEQCVVKALAQKTALERLTRLTGLRN